MDQRPIVSFVWASGKLGAAYYDFETSELYVLPDAIENAEDFEIVKIIYRQLSPSTVLINGRQDVRLIQVLKVLNGDTERQEHNNQPGVFGVEYDNSRADELPSSQSSSSLGPLPSSQGLRTNRQGTTRSNLIPERGGGQIYTSDTSHSSRVNHFSQLSDFSSTPPFSQSSETRRSLNENDNGVEDGGRDCKLITLPGKDFAPDACKVRLQRQRLPQEQFNEFTEHSVFISSLVSFKNVFMVRAAGALLGFLDKNSVRMFRVRPSASDQGHIYVSNIKLFQLDHLVHVEDSAWSSLQIFNSELHPATARRGVPRSAKEGLSLYKLLNRCFTLRGSKYLKMLLLRPTRNMDILKRRLDVIDYLCSPVNSEFLRRIEVCLKAIKNWTALLDKIETLTLSASEWKDFYQTIFHFILLMEAASQQPSAIQLFAELGIGEKRRLLVGVAEEMMKVIDLEETKACKRFVPKTGIDAELDRLRKQFSCLPNVMSRVADQEIERLPEIIPQCTVVYIPEIGYLLGINFWEEDLSLEDLEITGLTYKYHHNRIAYYKNDTMEEMDTALGDYQVAMIEQETTIMLGVANVVVQQKQTIVELGRLISELDCLLAMAKVANEHNFVRPTIIDSHGTLQIQAGRHPLLKFNGLNSQCVPNSTEFREEQRVVILTGPNASGKSVYLKQVGIIVLLALCGSFVPAVSAQIPTFDRICTRIHTMESVSHGLSTFMIDLNQMAFATREATRASLIIIDEFGKGTAEADGLALLVSTMNHFVHQGVSCPTIFLSTHFYSLMDFMALSPLLKLQSMKFLVDNHQITYLYKLKDGLSSKSFAFQVALEVGIPERVVQKSEERLEILQKRLPNDSSERAAPTEKENALLDLINKVSSVSAGNAEEYLREGFETMTPFRNQEYTVRKTPTLPGTNSPADGSSTSEEAVSEYFRRENDLHDSSTDYPASTIHEPTQVHAGRVTDAVEDSNFNLYGSAGSQNQEYDGRINIYGRLNLSGNQPVSSPEFERSPPGHSPSFSNSADEASPPPFGEPVSNPNDGFDYRAESTTSSSSDESMEDVMENADDEFDVDSPFGEVDFSPRARPENSPESSNFSRRAASSERPYPNKENELAGYSVPLEQDTHSSLDSEEESIFSDFENPLGWARSPANKKQRSSATGQPGQPLRVNRSNITSYTAGFFSPY